MAIYKKLETRPAPLGTRGIIYWVRENLFPSITSSILTVLSFLLLYFTVPPLLDWMIFDATWTGTKDEITGTGARWIFIFEKFNQFIYGFYPEDQYWRPNLILVIFFTYIIGFKRLNSTLIRTFILILFPILFFSFIIWRIWS